MSCYINNLNVSIKQAKHLVNNNADEALKILYKVVRENDRTDIEAQELLSQAYCLLGKLHAQKHEDFLARENFQKAAAKTHSYHQQGLILLMQAEMEIEMGNTLIATEVLHDGFNQLMGDVEALAFHSCLQGIIASKDNDTLRAKEFYKEALTRSKHNRRKIITLILRHSSLRQKLGWWLWCRSIRHHEEKSPS